jgi:hypothetical protein
VHRIYDEIGAKSRQKMAQGNMTEPEESRNVSRISPAILGLVDFCLLNGAFFSLHYWKRGTFDLSPMYVKLLIAFGWMIRMSAQRHG